MPQVSVTVILIQATILNAIANLLAQVIYQYHNKKPFGINTLALLQFTAHAIPVVPPNVYWQRWLEARYPGFPSWSGMKRNMTMGSSTGSWSMRGKRASEDVLPRKEKASHGQQHQHQHQPSGMRSFAMKFFFDQTVGSVLNIVLFIVTINLIKGESWHRVWELVGEDFPPIMMARLKYRPVVSTLMYTVVPVDRRVVFASACGVIWGVYLSLYAAV